MPPKFLDTDIFSDLRRKGGCYVDKTGFLEQFLDAPDKVTLFIRPRRFGKTLFMSMLAEFFDIKNRATGRIFLKVLPLPKTKNLSGVDVPASSDFDHLERCR